LNPRQRAFTALSMKEPDRVPLDYWADDTITQNLISRLGLKSKEALLKEFGIDFRYIEGTVLINGKQPDKDGSWEDIWGVKRKKIKSGKSYYENVTEYPLAKASTVKEIEDYKGWPSADIYDYSRVEQMASVHEGYCVICGGDRLNRTAQLKPAMYLRGIEQILFDLATDEKLVCAINERLVHFFLEYNRRIFENSNKKIDIFFMGDDFGTQMGLMMSIGMWRRLFKPGFRRFIELAHKFDIKVMHHSCGAVSELIPDFIDCGLDILQSLQPTAAGMDLARIKKEYGRHICFQGGVDITRTMPFGSVREVKSEVKKLIDTMSPGGGYILCTSHNIQADTPEENVLAMYEEGMSHRYGH